jgi:hypothetical protein
MNPKDRIHGLIDDISKEVLQFIRDHESPSNDRWVAAAQIKRDLELNFVAVPKANRRQNETGWLFGVIARLLEDRGLIDYRRFDNNRSYCRSAARKEIGSDRI